MTFVIEKIPQDALSSSNQELVNINTKLSQEWAIDRDRNAFIVLTRKVGGPYEGTHITKYYTLSWNNELIRIAADPLPCTYAEHGAIMNWRVHKLAIPDVLMPQKEAVLDLIQDAMKAVGDCFNGYEYIACKVQFDLPTSN